MVRKENEMYKTLIVTLVLILLVACASQPTAYARDYSHVDKAGALGDGNVVPVGLIDSIKGISWALQNNNIWTDPSNTKFLFGWPMGSNYGFFGIDSNNQVIDEIRDFCGANKTGCFSFTGLVKALEDKGWVPATSSDVPTWIVSTFGSVSAFMADYGSILASPIFMIVPATLIPVQGQD
jgi:hypothetical protein